MGWQQFLVQFALPQVASHFAYVRGNYPVLEPEDVVQDFYVRLASIWERAPQDPDEIRRWLFGVLGNCARELWRKEKKGKEGKQQMKEQLLRSGLPRPPPPELPWILEEALKKLDPMERKALIDRVLYNFTYKEIGKKFGWSTAKAFRVIQKVCRELRRVLK